MSDEAPNMGNVNYDELYQPGPPRPPMPLKEKLACLLIASLCVVAWVAAGMCYKIGNAADNANGLILQTGTFVKQEQPKVDSILENSNKAVATVSNFATPDTLQDLKNDWDTTAYTAQSTANTYGTVGQATVETMDVLKGQLKNNGSATEQLIKAVTRNSEIATAAIDDIRRQVIPRTADLLSTGNDTFQKFNDRSAPILANTASAISRFDQLERDPRVEQLFDNTNHFLDRGAYLADRSGAFMNEAYIYGHQVNAPQTARQKIFSIGFKLLLPAVTAIRR